MPTRSEIINALWTREQAARVLNFNPSNLDRLKALGRVHPLVNENGRAIAYFKEEILSMIGGAYRVKPGRQPAKAAKQESTTE